MRPGWFPSSHEYDCAPELGALAILADVLEAVSLVLFAANRELFDDARPHSRPLPPTVPAADKLLRQIDRLRRAIDAYCRLAAPTPAPASPPGDDMPF
jgi:hypothetical protein